MKKLAACKSKLTGKPVDTILAVLVFIGSFLLLEYSYIYGFSSWTNFLEALNFRYILINFVVLGSIWSIVLVLCFRVWLASLILSVICGSISIINHYVLVLHGMPLSFLLLRNLSTAANVMSGYNITVDNCSIRLFFGLVCLVGACLTVKFVFYPKSGQGRSGVIENIVLMLAFFAGFGVCYLGDNPVKPVKTLNWHWLAGYGQYGYAACSVESFFQMRTVVNEPDGYSMEALREIEIHPPQDENNRKPDVILILNESLYDLNQITDIQTDIPYLRDCYAQDNVVYGYAVVPSVGGGTNSSEYELLTSNSLELMPGVTPFNTLDLNSANSIVSFVKQLGYHTTASHSAGPGNYSRGLAYPAMGFDQSFFLEDYQELENNHNRLYTDESSYKNLIRWYQEAPEDQPRFLYMLTFQNHGAYEQNAPEQDLVHVKNDYGEYTQQVNEFLSSIYLSDKAFCQLIEYFSRVDRQVIICMLGDHSPLFAPSIASDAYTEEERNLRLRKVPLLFWANFEMEGVKLDTVSMNYVVPTLLELADMPLSPYYSYLLQAREQVPVMSSYGRYYDVDGDMYLYSEAKGAPFQDVVDQYFFLEYHNLQESRMQLLYDPY